ncbi:MAG: ABC transporter ATP-binding protein/permease [Clostridiales bacterium]|nr:ABC transporter ATP-binding protein/permease [Clostridiales bacterium]
MLEVKHLKKDYKTKNGTVTKALDDVSLNFHETGMVFILGKSGSGKSTLLNICGGLDRMDEGEIIIKGKSSKNFTSQDFDSYRNTYVGFVFQEYNILDEFTVAQNIALALELQNKKPDSAVIDKILADVDLTDFASRKPNTLSGGQKQRVAIARALVKEPEIIMADEPTGALDSKTGQQVFDTLKKLSKEKLVIVISHDRDFAEQYGDRIIELKDGKVISDQTRAENDTAEQNVKFYGTDTVCVRSGSELSDDDLRQIKTFLAKSGGTAVISTSREKIAQFKEDRPEISVGTFENIKEQPVPKSYEPQKLIRSHLPVRHAVKMGAGSLKAKPIRLIFTIFLSVVAFVLFGLASTLMLFDGHEVKVQSFMDSSPNYIPLGKIYYVTYTYDDGDTDKSSRDTRFTQEEYEKYAAQYSGAIPMVSYSTNISRFSLEGAAQNFYSTTVYGIVPASKNLNLSAGRMPQNDDEVAITEFMFDAFTSSKSTLTYGNGTKLEAQSYDDILYTDAHPVTIGLDNKEYKIVGVFKGSKLPPEYKAIKNAATGSSQSSDSYSWTWDGERRNGMYMTVAVTDKNFRNFAKTSGNYYIDYDSYFKESADYAYIRVNSDDIDDSAVGTEALTNQFNRFALYKDRTLKLYGTDGSSKTAVANGEAAVSSKLLIEYYRNVMTRLANQFDNDGDRLNAVYSKAYEEYAELYPWDGQEDSEAYYRKRAAYAEKAKYDARTDLNKKYLQVIDRIQSAAETKFRENNPEPKQEDYPDTDAWQVAHNEWVYGLSNAMSDADPRNILTSISDNYGAYAPEEIVATIKTVTQFIDELDISVTFEMYSETDDPQNAVVSSYFISSTWSSCYLGEDLYKKFYNARQDNYGSGETKYVDPEDGLIDSIFVPYDGTRAAIEKLLNKSGVAQSDDSAVKINSVMLEQLDMIIDTADMLQMVFVIVGAILAAFAFLLMFNFISASITAKKKEIGILRAIGARTVDVFKIFISEAFIIALICFAVSTAGTFGVCILLNSVLLEGVGISMSLFVFGPLSVLFIFGIAFITALISTIIPVTLYSKKPPIASIRAL